MRDKVSVIIPTYNSSKYLKNAIDSVRNQTFKNYEIIIVDDGSTDNTQYLVREYKYDVKYLYQENGGVAKARNTGIIYASGNYLAFLDADDVWLPEKLEMQIKCMKYLKNVHLTFTNFITVSGDKECEYNSIQRTFNVLKEFNIQIEDIFCNKVLFKDITIAFEMLWGDVFKYLFLGNFILPSTVMIRKEIIENGYFFNEKYRVAEDTDYFLRISRNYDIGYLNYPLTKYCMPSVNNLSGRANTEKLIKNALESQLIFKKEKNYRFDEKKYVNAGISKTYLRLAYFYLSELRNNDAKKNSVLSLIENSYEYRAILIFMASLLPSYVLQKIKYIVQILRKIYK